MKKKRSERRLRHERITIRVTLEERRTIMEKADACGKSEGEYLRERGLGFSPASRIDQRNIGELSKFAADLGRLGGLLKLWLGEIRKGLVTARFPVASDIDGLYRDIVASQQLLRTKILEL